MCGGRSRLSARQLASHLELVGFVHQAEPVSRPQPVDVIGPAAFGKLVGLHVVEPYDRLGHDAPVPVLAEALLPTVVVRHADVVPDHVRHRAGEQVGFVGVDVHADAHRLGAAHRRGDGDTRLAAHEHLSSQQLRGVSGHAEQLPHEVVAEVAQCLVDGLAALDLGLVASLPRLDVHHRHPRVYRAEIEVGDVGHLDGVVDHFGAGAAVPLLEHGLVDDDGRLYVLGRLADVSAEAHSMERWRQEAGVVFQAPLDVGGDGAALARLGACLEYHVRMLLLKKSKAVQ